MAINFPASPSVNDTFTEGSITYKWDGAKWIGLGVTPADKLVEGSNSLEINASNDLVWTGGKVLVGTSSAYVADTNLQITDDTNPKLVLNNPGNSTYSIAVGTDNQLAFRNEAQARTDLWIDYSTGDVGIGQPSPQGDLHIGNISGSKDLIMHAANNGDALIRFREGGTNTSGFNEYSIGMDGGRNSLVVNGQGSGEIIAVKGDDGTVGINVIPTQQKLTIDVDSSGTTQASFDGINIVNTNNTTNNGSAIIFGQTIAGNSNARIGVINTDRSGGSEDQDIFFGTLGGGSYKERLRVRSNGDLILGPYDPPGTFTNAADNIPYSIKVAPYGWSNGTELAAISMGNHSGATGNDEGEIVFKTAQNVHTDATGLVERARINSNGSFTVSTYGGLQANGTPANLGLWQASGGKITMASSGTYQRFMHCGHTCNATLYLYVTSGDQVNGGGHMFEYRVQVVYGSPGIDLVDSRVFGSTSSNISAVNVQYNNSGYQLEVQVNWTSGTTLPRANWAIQGMSSSSFTP